MKKIVILLLISALTSLMALDMPILNKQEIYLENGKFTVMEFPFKIKKTINSGFLVELKTAREEEYKGDSDIDSVMLPEDKPTATTKKKKAVITKIKNPIEIKQGQMSLTLLPKKLGSFELIIWGYKKYPIMLTIHVVDIDSKESTPTYYNFLDYETDKEEAKSFEKTAHEKVIIKLVRAIYNNKLPTGYKSLGYSQDFTNASDVLLYKLNRAYIGNAYRVDEWVIRNIGDESVKLYEEAFYTEGVYGISFENDLLPGHQQTRMFVVAARKFNTAENEEIE